MSDASVYPLGVPATVGHAGRIVARVMQDLTVYLAGPSEQELDFLVDLYARMCPAERLVRYKIAELPVWPRIDEPVWTASSRAAAASKRPYFEPTRKRIREGRSFAAQLWDGREIDDPAGSWSFNCQRIHRRSSGLHAFVRILVPPDVDPGRLRDAAVEIAGNVEFHSGHGGLTFAYDPWFGAAAFDGIYALARRFWCVDVEHLNSTLPLMREGIKGVGWLTLLGRRLAAEADLTGLAETPDIEVTRHRCGVVVVAGARPFPGDQHRPGAPLPAYEAIARALAPWFVASHPDFPGERFLAHGDTVAWIRRFLEPEGWR